MIITTTIIIADDHPLFRNALKNAISGALPAVTIKEAHDIKSLQAEVEKTADASLILLDLNMPGAHGFSGLIHLTAHHPGIPVVIISAHESADVINRAMNHGAAGFLPKSSQLKQITDAINTVLRGGIWLPDDYDPGSVNPDDNGEELKVANVLATLTPQQFRVATMLAQGLLNKQIAYELNVTEATIKAHMTEIYRKLGVSSRTQAVLTISQLDVQPPSDSL